jgi:rubrerythrin
MSDENKTAERNHHMETKDLIEALSLLMQVDIDALHSYRQALDEIEDKIIRDRLQGFMAEHQHHIDHLADQIRAMDGQPPSLSKDFKGFVIEGFTALRSSAGTIGALKALKTTETLTNRHYANAVSLDFPAELKQKLRKHFTDEKIHLDYITLNLKALT